MHTHLHVHPLACTPTCTQTHTYSRDVKNVKKWNKNSNFPSLALGQVLEMYFFYQSAETLLIGSLNKKTLNSSFVSPQEADHTSKIFRPQKTFKRRSISSACLSKQRMNVTVRKKYVPAGFPCWDQIYKRLQACNFTEARKASADQKHDWIIFVSETILACLL